MDETTPQQSTNKPLLSRRSFCYGAGGLALLAVTGSAKITDVKDVARPPGGQNKWTLISACVHCAKCVEACPHRVITLSHIENGVVGMRTPQMDFSADWCNFCVEENGGVPLCAVACPTGALSVDGAPGPEVIIGKAVLVEDWCLAYHDTGCHTCYDNCPYDAIELDEYNRPYIVDELCNGCGACEATCISLSSGSLSMSSGVKTRAVTIAALKS